MHCGTKISFSNIWTKYTVIVQKSVLTLTLHQLIPSALSCGGALRVCPVKTRL